jgi:hypothetical protein
MAISHLSEGDLDALGKLNAAIDKANLVDDKAQKGDVDARFGVILSTIVSVRAAIASSVSAERRARELADQSERTDRQAADAAEEAERVATLTAEREARELADQTETTQRLAGDEAERSARIAGVAELQAVKAERTELLDGQIAPGEEPLLWTQDITNAAGAALDPALAATGSHGRVIRVSVPTTISRRGFVKLEPGRAYRARFAVRRIANSPDPSNDGVRLGIRWFSQAKTVISGGTTIVADWLDLTTAAGRREASAVFSGSAGAMIDAVWPAGACYARPFVQIFGVDAITDIEVVASTDVTDANVYAPDVSAFAARLAGLESEDLPDRVATLEAATGTVSAQSFRTTVDLAAALVPGSVQVVHLLWGATVGDGLGGQYVRGVSGEVQSADGAYWSRLNPLFRPAPEAVAAAGVSDQYGMTPLATTHLLTALFAGLPTTLPATSGVLWNNGGMLSFS